MFGLMLLISIASSLICVLFGILCYKFTKDTDFTINTSFGLLVIFAICGSFIMTQNKTNHSSKTYQLRVAENGQTQYSKETNDDPYSNVTATYTFQSNNGQSIKVDDPNKITYNNNRQSKLVKTTYNEYLTLFGHKFHLDSYTKNHIYIIK